MNTAKEKAVKLVKDMGKKEAYHFALLCKFNSDRPATQFFWRSVAGEINKL